MTLNAEQRAAMVRHGYDPDLPPRGTSGPPGTIHGIDDIQLRNHVCALDGIVIDGHRRSDLDWGADDDDEDLPACTYCREKLTPGP